MIPYRLFDPINEMTAFLIYTDTIEAVRKWMGNSVTVFEDQAYVTPVNNDPDSEGYEVVLPYLVNMNKSVGTYHAILLR